MKTTSHKELVILGFPEHTSRNIIKQAKTIAVVRFKEASNLSDNVIELNKSPFENSRLDLAPTCIVEELLGFKLLS